MKYDCDSGEIMLTVNDFVSIARRGISPTLPYDDEEPDATSASAIAIRDIIGENKSSTLYFGCEGGGYRYRISGHCDGLDNGVLTVIKCVNDDPTRVRKSDLAQVRGEAFILGYMYCKLSNSKLVTLRTVFYNEMTKERASTEEIAKLPSLERFFNKCLIAVTLYSRPECERVSQRLPSMAELRFPFREIREGQSDLCSAVHKALRSGGTLYASAPTGTGKTVSVLYPALRALGEGRIDKVFYLTPKTTTAEAARDCLELFASSGAIIRAVILSSKERCCRNRLVCRENKSACANSRSAKLADAVIALYDLGATVVTRREIDVIAPRYGVCPYELELSYSELCDVVICDFNYLFDPTVYIRRFFTEGGRFGFLIDEAHNLPDRAREMYSSELSQAELDAVADSPLIGELSPIKEKLRDASKALSDLLMPYVADEMRRDEDGEPIGATHLYEPPLELYDLVESLAEELDKELKRSYSSRDEDADRRTRLLRDTFYKIKNARDTLMRFDGGYRMFIFFEKGSISFKLFCMDTGARIRACTDKGAGTVFFSATLSPIGYYRSLLGGDGASDSVSIDSPFDPSALSVSIIDKISTRYSERERTLGAIVRVIAATLSARKGNYMVFAPSFAYAEAIHKAFSAKYPKVKTMLQTPSMSDAERGEFLKCFADDNSSYLVGFCVMGGIYSEGIDLAGDSLIGAIVVGIGMPGMSFEREAMADYYEARYEEGKQYAYIYPGMNRVLQAAGRVIRRENDRGVIILIDDRFADPIYKKSIPKLWDGMAYVGDVNMLKERLAEFWSEVDKERRRNN